MEIEAFVTQKSGFFKIYTVNPLFLPNLGKAF